MRPWTLLLSLTVFAAAPAHAQNPWEDAATVEQAVARAVSDAMAETRYPWSLNWSAFGIRGGRDVFWHLAPPNPYIPVPLPEGVHRRTGWISVRGRSGGVAVCGDAERIGGMSISVAGLWLGEGDVIAELTARGVRSTLVETREAVIEDDGEGRASGYYRDLIRARPALQRWRLEQADHDPAELSAVHACTPPGTRHATHCWVTWKVVFQPDDPTPGADCPVAGRYGS